MERKPNGSEQEIQLMPQARWDKASNIQRAAYPSKHFIESLTPMAHPNILAQPKLVFVDKPNKTYIQNTKPYPC